MTNEITKTVNIDANAAPERGGWQPALTLAVLSPLIAEVLSGATKFSVLFVLVPEILVWGCGALVIREAVRRWRGGWTSMLLLGLGLSIAEEFVVQQTSLAPLPFTGALVNYGRAWGVNWIYFLFMLGYESVWVVLVPVQVTELIFRNRREEPWLRNRGLIISGVLFLVGSRIAWYAWIKRARPMVFHLPPYDPGMTLIGAGVAAIAVLAMIAYLVQRVGTGEPVEARRVPPVWLATMLGFVLGCPFYLLMSFQFAPKEPRVPFGVVMAGGMAWGAMVYVVVGWMTRSAQWSDVHRWALTFGATVLCMAAGYLGSSTWMPIDLYGKIGLNVVAVGAFFVLLARVRRQRPVQEPARG
ncbi:MAG TPA: hypothetical protein VMT38_04975 [Terracidiphilus sp.]|nr:hypothetical protein [Terracidiphilus sp.]